MRQRSKSMGEFSGKKKQDDENFDDESDESDEDHCWAPEENMRLLRRVFQRVPKNDSLPYDQRIKAIDWKVVTFDDWKPEDVKHQFHELLSRARTFRLLSEILKDLEKDVLTTLHLPKKPATAFALFLQDQKDKIDGKGGFARAAAKAYKDLDDDEKQKYQTRADELKKSYEDTLGKLNLEDRKAPRNKNLNATTKHRLVVHSFWEHRKQKGEDISYFTARTLFAEMNKKKKLKWLLKFLGVSQGDKLNLEQYKKAKDCLTKEEMAIIDEYEGRPKKLSSYNIFLREYFGSHSKDETAARGEAFKAVGEKWKNLSQKEKINYEMAANTLHSSFKENYIKFLSTLEPSRQIFEAKGYLTKDKGAKKKEKNNANDSKLSSMDDDSDNQPKTNKLKKKKNQNKESAVNLKSDKDDQVSQNKSQSDTGEEEVLAVFTAGGGGNCQLSDDDIFKSPLKTEEQRRSIPASSIKKGKRRRSDSETKSENHACESDDLSYPFKQQHSLKENTMSDVNIESSSKKKRKKDSSISESDLDQSINKSSDLKTPTKKGERNNKSDAESSSKKKERKRDSKSDLDSEQNSNKTRADTSSSKKKEKALSFLRKRPPSSVFKYYVKEIYEGPLEKAKKTYKRLNSNEREVIEANYRKFTKKYLKEFREHLETLTPEEIQRFKDVSESSDNVISDLTESDSDDN